MTVGVLHTGDGEVSFYQRVYESFSGVDFSRGVRNLMSGVLA